MKRALSILFLALIVLTSVAYGQKKQEKKVRKAFEGYKTAILNDKGEKAVDFVDSRTVSYYGRMAEQTRTADSLTLESMNILDKLMVFSIRQRATREEILSFDGRGLLIYAIESGMVGKNSVAGNTIGEVEVDADFAKGQFIANGKPAPFYFHFYKEDGQWKVDLTSLFPIATTAFTTVAQQSGKGENEFLFGLLELANGKRPGREVWQTVE